MPIIMATARNEAAVRTLAFPAISCGVYGYPLEKAVAIAVRECTAALRDEPLFEKIVFACFGAEALAAYEAELSRVAH